MTDIANSHETAPPNAAPFLVLKHVTHSFGKGATSDAIHAVGPISFSLEPGEFVAVVGPSGCGKSTLLRLLAGLEPLQSGEITFEGAPVRGPSPSRGMMFQQPALYPWLSVARNVAFGAKFGNLPADERSALVTDLIDSVGLSGFEDFYPAKLSGGMQQRAALARTLAGQPELLLLDEPFGALDQQTRAQMQEWLTGLIRARGITALLVTHDIEEAVYLADRVLVMSGRPGRLLDEVPVDLPRPRQKAVRTTPPFTALKARISTLLEAAPTPPPTTNHRLS